MTEFALNKDGKSTLKQLIPLADKSKKSYLEATAKKDILTFEDLTGIKDALPKNVPVFAFFNKLTIHQEQSTYKASAAFRARTDKLRIQQENQAYRRIVESVDPMQKYGKVEHLADFGTEMKTVNRQMISVINVLITVGGAFVFGFFGINYAYPHLHLDMATRMIFGLVLATIVFFADLYFVIKSMDIDEEFGPEKNLSFKNMAESNKQSDNDITSTIKSNSSKKND